MMVEGTKRQRPAEECQSTLSSGCKYTGWPEGGGFEQGWAWGVRRTAALGRTQDAVSKGQMLSYGDHHHEVDLVTVMADVCQAVCASPPYGCTLLCPHFSGTIHSDNLSQRPGRKGRGLAVHSSH